MPASYGDLLPEPAAAEQAARTRQAAAYPSAVLEPADLALLELLLTGALWPLGGYMTRAELAAARAGEPWAGGGAWPAPILLGVGAAAARRAHAEGVLALRDPTGLLLAILRVEDAWPADPAAPEGAWHVGGALEGAQAPPHYDHADLRLRPAALRARFAGGGGPVWAWQTAAVPTRAHVEEVRAAAEAAGARLLLHAEAPPEGEGDAAFFARMRCAGMAARHMGPVPAVPALLPMPFGGAPLPEALFLRAVIARNCGAGRLLTHRPLHAEAAEAAARAAALAGVEIAFLEPAPARPAESALHDDVRAAWSRAHPPRTAQGFTVFFTGLSGSGKSTIANALKVRLQELTGRPVTLLDGDVVRHYLSRGLGFDRAGRSENVQRIGYVAAEITRHGGIAVCAPIAPYAADRDHNRRLIEAHGGFIEAHVDAPLAVCEQRDVKGLYARARAGEITGFTGIDDPYEAPKRPEVVCRTGEQSVAESVEAVVGALRAAGYLGAQEAAI